MRRSPMNNVPSHCCPRGGHCRRCHPGLGTAPHRGRCSGMSCPSAARAPLGIETPGRRRPRCVRGAEPGAWGSPWCRCPAPGWAAGSSAQVLPLPAGHGGRWLVSVGNRPSRLLRLPALAFGSGQARRRVPGGDGTAGTACAGWRGGSCRRPRAVPSPQTAAAVGRPGDGTAVGAGWGQRGAAVAAAGLALAQRTSRHPGEGGALAAPRSGSLGAVAHTVSLLGVPGARRH